MRRYKIVLYADPKTEMPLINNFNVFLNARMEQVNAKPEAKFWIVLHVVPPVHIETKPELYIRDAHRVFLRKQHKAIQDLYEEKGIPVIFFTPAKLSSLEEELKILEPPQEAIEA